MASVVVQVRVDETERARWLELAKDAGLSLSDFVRRRMKSPAESDSLEGVSFTHGAPTVGIDANPGRIAELDKIIAEKDAEIADLKTALGLAQRNIIVPRDLVQGEKPLPGSVEDVFGVSPGLGRKFTGRLGVPAKPCENPKCACKKCVAWERQYKWVKK